MSFTPGGSRLLGPRDQDLPGWELFLPTLKLDWPATLVVSRVDQAAHGAPRACVHVPVCTLCKSYGFHGCRVYVWRHGVCPCVLVCHGL